MNPNANSFSFSGGAPMFTPGQVRRAPQYPQQGQQQNGPIRESWEDDQPAYGQQQQQGAYYGQQQYGQQGYYGQQQQPGYGQGFPHQQHQPYYNPQQQQQFQPQIMQRNNNNNAPSQSHLPSQHQPYIPPQAQAQTGPPKVISIGGAKPAAASTSSDAPAKSSTISLSIGGGSKPAQAQAAATAAEKEKKPAASTSDITPALKTAQLATSSSSDAAAPPTSTKAPAAETPAKKKEEAIAAPSAEAPKPAPSAPSASASTSISVGPAAKKVEKSADAIAEQVAAVADEEELKDLFGGKEESTEQREHVNIVFIGHVDAGKSTMGGRILVDCGMVDKRTLEKYEKESKEAGRESWYLSWALDSTSQERTKGITVEVGRAYFETEKRRYTILDAPGHKSFVPSMITGAAQADVAILVVSARKGEFETGFEKGGQTREHVMLVKTAGISKIVVAINKMDDPTVQWSKERWDEVVGKLTPFMKQSGYNPKTDVTFIPVSGFTGANIKTRITDNSAPYYTGPSLLEFLDNLPMTDRKVNAPLMIPISEKYKDMGTIVVGKVESGRVRRGDTVTIMPNKNQVEITAIYSENEEEIPSAICGDNIRLRLRGIDDEDISVGFVISAADKPVHAVTHFEAQLIILDHKNIICAGYSAVMHVHTAAEEVNLAALLHYYDKKTGRKSRRPPQFAKKGQKIVALVEASQQICIERFDDHPQLGRFTLRDEGKTIAIGKVTKLIQTSEEMPDMAKLAVGAGGTAPAATTAANGA